MHSSTQYESGTMDTADPIELITYLALNKDRNFCLSQPDFCQTMQVFSIKKKKQSSHCFD